MAKRHPISNFAPNLHCILSDERVEDAYHHATAVMVEGWPSAMLAGCKAKQRVAWLDARPDLGAPAERMHWRIYHVGNEPGVFARAMGGILTGAEIARACCADGQ